VGIFDRLGDVIRSYLNDEDSRIFGRGKDPDMEEAEAELESFLRGEGPRTETGDWGDSRRNSTGSGSRDWTDTRAWSGTRDRAGSRDGARTDRRSGGWNGAEEGARRRDPAGPPEELRPDFAELGLPFGAGAEECKMAYRRLLKLHHPDRHAGHQGNMEKATRKMARINAAYDRIERWRAGKGM
jgi:hypothetical protein